MLDSQITKSTFKRLAVNENRFCFECNSRSPSWASLPYGIFLCYNCSGIHRGLTPQISFVRSIEMDSWSEKQLNMMMLGGNKNLQDFFASHGINLSNPKKFNTVAAHYYREKMRALVNGTEMPEEPPNWSDLYDQAPKKPPEVISWSDSIGSRENQLQNFQPQQPQQAPPQQQGLPQQQQQQQQQDDLAEPSFWELAQGAAINRIHKIDNDFNKTNFAKDIKTLGTELQQKSKQLGVEKSSQMLAKTVDSVKKGFDDVLGYFKSKNENQIPQVQQQSPPAAQQATQQPQQRPTVEEYSVYKDFASDQPQQGSSQQVQANAQLIDYEQYFFEDHPEPESQVPSEPQPGQKEINLLEDGVEQKNEKQKFHDLLEL